MIPDTDFRYNVSSPEEAAKVSVEHFRRLLDVVEVESGDTLSLEQVNKAIEIVVGNVGDIMWRAGRESGIKAATQVTVVDDMPFVPGAGRDC